MEEACWGGAHSRLYVVKEEKGKTRVFERKRWGWMKQGRTRLNRHSWAAWNIGGNCFFFLEFSRVISNSSVKKTSWSASEINGQTVLANPAGFVRLFNLSYPTASNQSVTHVLVQVIKPANFTARAGPYVIQFQGTRPLHKSVKNREHLAVEIWQLPGTGKRESCRIVLPEYRLAIP